MVKQPYNIKLMEKKLRPIQIVTKPPPPIIFIIKNPKNSVKFRINIANKSVDPDHQNYIPNLYRDFFSK